MSLTLRVSSKIKFSLRALGICVWLVEALAGRKPIDADAISYLNMANAFLSRGWHALVNGYWSPAYPFLLACELKVFRPDPFHHFLAMNLLSFVSLIAALVCFEYFIQCFFEFRQQAASASTIPDGEMISDDAVWLMGYALFFWVTIFFTPASLEHPDILVFICYLLASAVSMQLLYRHEWWRYALLGLVLGLGYLAKSVMFPLGFAFLARCTSRAGNPPFPHVAC